jgi:hypothetical protein
MSGNGAREARTPRMISRAVRAAVAFAMLALGVAAVAYADFFGADVPILTNILATALQQLDTANRTFETLGRAYHETKRIATYAGDAREAFAEIQSFSGNRARNSGVKALYRAFPELSFLQGDLGPRDRSFGRTPGSLSPELQRCLQEITRDSMRATRAERAAGPAVGDTASACDQWQKTVTAQRLEQELWRNFGDLPRSRPDLAMVRTQDVAHERAYQAELLKKASVEKQVYEPKDGMLEKCVTARDPVVCQTLSAQAQIQMFEQQAETNRKMEELIHQQSVANEIKIAEARRVEEEESSRRASLVEGLRAFGWKGSVEPPSSPPPPSSSPGALPAGGDR